jgi:4-azaleucine resistance transporter AzlC
MLRDILLVCAADGIIGFSFGALTVSGGLPAWLPTVMSVVVFAGGAQFAAVGVMLAGGGPWAAALTGLALNGRMLAYGFTLPPEVLGRRRLTQLLGLHLIIDETIAFSMRQSTLEAKRRAFWVTGLTLFVVWNLAVVLGVVVGHALGDASRLGLDAAFPAMMLALIWPALSARSTRQRAAAGSVLALIGTQWLAPGLPVLAALVVLVPALLRLRGNKPRDLERAVR